MKHNTKFDRTRKIDNALDKEDLRDRLRKLVHKNIYTYLDTWMYDKYVVCDFIDPIEAQVNIKDTVLKAEFNSVRQETYDYLKCLSCDQVSKQIATTRDLVDLKVISSLSNGILVCTYEEFSQYRTLQMRFSEQFKLTSNIRHDIDNSFGQP